MMSKTGLQAVKALALLANLPKGEFAGAAHVARDTGAPQNYLGKMLQQLAREGLVVSQKGLNGGFRLARPAESINLFDILDPIDRVGRWNGCFMGKPDCSADHPCAVHFEWQSMRDHYLSFLRTTTLAQIAAGRSVLHPA